jgi:hypothetical protein
MTTFTEEDGATLAWIGEEDEGAGGSEGRGRLGRRHSRRQWAGYGSLHRHRVQPGRCTTDADEVPKDVVDLIGFLNNGRSLQFGRTELRGVYEKSPLHHILLLYGRG